MESGSQRLKRLVKAQTYMKNRAEKRVAALSATLVALDERENAARKATDRPSMTNLFADFYVRFFHRLAEERAVAKKQLEAAQLDQHYEKLKLEKLQADASIQIRDEHEKLEQETRLEVVTRNPSPL